MRSKKRYALGVHGLEDIINRLLVGVHLDEATPYSLSFSGQWGFSIPGHHGVIVCYCVLEGSCFVQVGGQERQLHCGDAWALLDGSGYEIVSEPQVDTQPLCTIDTQTGVKRHYRSKGKGATTRFVIVALYAEHAQTNPLLHSLPGWLHIPGNEGRPKSGLQMTIKMMKREFDSGRLGMTPVVQRLGEILLIQIIRACIQSTGTVNGTDGLRGTLRGIADPHLCKAITAMHADLGRQWQLSALARSAGMSRTAFATAFMTAVEMSPFSYLRRLRMHHACALLCDPNLKVAEIAYRVGYQSEATFSRAFKRELSVAPSSWRQQRKT